VTGGTPVVRPGRPSDAPAVAAMANDLNTHLGKPHRPFTAGLVLRHGFGAEPAFSLLVGELDGRVAGYAMYTDSYNSDVAARELFVIDLFVAAPARGRGLGRGLLATVAACAVARGIPVVSWGVHARNRAARAFYRRLGAREDDVRFVELDGPALAALAAEGRPVRSGDRHRRRRARGSAGRGRPGQSRSTGKLASRMSKVRAPPGS
jgi:GNAT superfamily N-acetyltransferase